MSAPQRPTPAATARLRTGGDCLRFANRLFRSAGVAHGQGFVNAEEESLTLMGHATGLAWEKLDELVSFTAVFRVENEG